VVATLDENTRSDIEDWLTGFQETYNLSEDRYLTDLKRITMAIAAHGNAVILGRGASFLLPTEKRIALLFVSPLELRIRNVMNDRGLSEKQAQAHIVKVATEHRNFAKEYFKAALLDSEHYHLVINTALVGAGTIAGMLKVLIANQS